VSENQNLLAEQRRALILDEVRRRGGVRVNELTRKLGVSDMTVRRDLDALARQGVLEKVHGGAVPVVEASTHEPGFEAKSSLEPTAKEEIARAAAAMADRPSSGYIPAWAARPWKRARSDVAVGAPRTTSPIGAA
jgi:DeoR/GlpR family transcriptional regulator of sugar metabolism